MKYRGLFFLIIIFSHQFTCYCQNDRNIVKLTYDIFLMKNNYDKTHKQTLLFKNSLVDELTNLNLDFLISSYSKIENETLIDFKRKMWLTINHCGYDLGDFDCISSDFLPNSIDDVISKYPNWNRILYKVSNIGYNEKKTQAILYYSFKYYNTNNYGASFLVFKKKGERWKLKKIIPVTAS